MKEYKQPETRIKRVKDEKGERFYPQYHLVLIPLLWQGWENILIELHNEEYVYTLDEAKARVDTFLTNWKYRWACDIEKAARKKILAQVRKEVEYFKYP